MRAARILAAAALALVAITTVGGAQQTTNYPDSAAKAKTHAAKKTERKTEKKLEKKGETQADLMKEARITMDSARVIALAKVPGATVESSEIERENGRLIYSFDMKRPGMSGIDEVNVNALTGKVVGKVQHESPKTEAKEAKVEAKEATKKK